MSSILIVHPDGKARDALSSILEKAGHATSSASDGPQAVAAFARRKPDVVLVNQSLPSMESFRVFGEIRRIAPTAKVLLFALIGSDASAAAPEKFGVPALRPSQVLRAVDQLPAGALRSGADLLPPRVLVVDDEAAVRTYLKRLLTEKGFEAAGAASGSDALAMLKRIRPHLVLLDVDMPGVDGVETLRRIRELDASVGVMMITADDSLETMTRCRDYGAYDYLTKPFDHQYLEFSVYSKLLLMTI